MYLIHKVINLRSNRNDANVIQGFGYLIAITIVTENKLPTRVSKLRHFNRRVLIVWGEREHSRNSVSQDEGRGGVWPCRGWDGQGPMHVCTARSLTRQTGFACIAELTSTLELRQNKIYCTRTYCTSSMWHMYSPMRNKERSSILCCLLFNKHFKIFQLFVSF